MALRIKSSQDFWTGCAFIAFGAATVVLARDYPLGSAARMGPGVLPDRCSASCWRLSVSGAAQIADVCGRRRRRARCIWLLLRVLLAVAAFALLLNPLGLVATA